LRRFGSIPSASRRSKLPGSATQGSELGLTTGFESPLAEPTQQLGDGPESLLNPPWPPRVARCASLAFGTHNLRNLFHMPHTAFINLDSEPWPHPQGSELG